MDVPQVARSSDLYRDIYISLPLADEIGDVKILNAKPKF